MKKEDKILKTIKTKMETKTINKNKAVELIKSSNGKFFTVTFLNKQNTARTINGRLKAPATKSGKNNAINNAQARLRAGKKIARKKVTTGPAL